MILIFYLNFLRINILIFYIYTNIQKTHPFFEEYNSIPYTFFYYKLIMRDSNADKKLIVFIKKTYKLNNLFRV